MSSEDEKAFHDQLPALIELQGERGYLTTEDLSGLQEVLVTNIVNVLFT